MLRQPNSSGLSAAVPRIAAAVASRLQKTMINSITCTASATSLVSVSWVFLVAPVSREMSAMAVPNTADDDNPSQPPVQENRCAVTDVHQAQPLTKRRSHELDHAQHKARCCVSADGQQSRTIKRRGASASRVQEHDCHHEKDHQRKSPRAQWASAYGRRRNRLQCRSAARFWETGSA